MGDTASFAATTAGSGFFDRYDRVLAKWPASTSAGDVPTRYGVTHVNECGADDAPPVVLLCGGGSTSTSWFGVAGALATRHHVIAVDMPGEPGRSVAGDRMQTVDDLMAWLAQVLDGLGVESVALVGHSYGAMVALAFATRHPERVGHLVLLDPNSCFAGFRAGYLFRALPLLMRPTAARQRALIGWETAGSEVDRDWLALVTHGAEHFPAARPIVPKRPRAGDLQRLDSPTTVVLAERSRVHDISRVEVGLRRSLPTASVVTVADASHYTLPMMPGAELADVLSGALRE